MNENYIYFIVEYEDNISEYFRRLKYKNPSVAVYESYSDGEWYQDVSAYSIVDKMKQISREDLMLELM
jgi:hypothetical protein